jgi:uncharacterized protein with von Willebrand factor type A (vWA) domain
MAKPFLLLLDVFMALRERGFELGIQEYLIALRLLAENELVSSRQDLILACQLMWAKSLEEQQLVAQTLEMFLPPRLDSPELASWLGDVEKEKAALDKESDQTAEPKAQDDAPPSKPESSSVGLGPELRLPFELVAATSLEDVSDPAISPGQPDPQDLTAGPPDAATALDADTVMEIKGHFTLDKPPEEEDDEDKFIFEIELPVPDRQIRQAWRKLRRFRRSGPAVEMDVEATLTRFSKQGGVLNPVLRPHLRNEARLLVLADEGGSMLPFRHIIQPLLEAIRQSGLAEVKVVYFHNVPGREVFTDWRMEEVVRLEDLVATPATPQGILIISDGGAARHRYSEERLEKTLEILTWLRNYTPRIAWLNPLPAVRWPGSTAGVLDRGRFVPMFALEREGLIRCVASLQRAGN